MKAEMGLLLLIQGGEVLALTADAATIRRKTGAAYLPAPRCALGYSDFSGAAMTPDHAPFTSARWFGPVLSRNR